MDKLEQILSAINETNALLEEIKSLLKELNTQFRNMRVDEKEKMRC